MPKASPVTRSFNAGEFSDLLRGRVDLERYASSVRLLKNFVAAPQGPAISRSGTMFVAPVADEAEKSTLVPFVFSAQQANVLEFGADRIRFFTEDGVQTYVAVAATVTSDGGDPIVINAPGLDAELHDQVALSDFPASYNLNGEIANITAKVGDTYTLDVNYPLEAVVNGKVARVYHVPCVYSAEERETLRYVQSVDVVYLLTPTAKPRKLSRFGSYDWRLEEVSFIDGPYLPTNTTSTTFTPSSTGNAVPAMTSDTLPSGTCSGSGNRSSISGSPGAPVNFIGRNITYSLAGSEFYYAFDNDDSTYWAADTEQAGTIQYAPATAFVCDGYTIYAARDNQDTSYNATDFAPSSFTFEGYDGSSWTVLDEQNDYVLYDGSKSVFIEIDNTVAYEAYRLVVSKLTRNGLIEPRVRRLVMREKDNTTLTLTASATTGINADAGFVATDIGRLVRLRAGDGSWRSCEITAVSSTTQVTVKLLGEPLLDTKPIRDWRLGYWSDTTGWPGTGDFFEDRLWLAGTDEYPDMFAASVVGEYETFSQTDTFGEVLDDSAIVGRLNARRLSRIYWIASDTRGLLMGTGSEEYTLAASNDEALTARNVRARPATRRGSANVQPVQVDDQALYVQRGGRTLREFAFVFEADGYKSPSMSQLASHLGESAFAEIRHAVEPHSIVWVRRADGSLVGLTYNREEQVVGWHQHDLSGAAVESMAVIPQRDQLQDALWCVLTRQVDGRTRRYIERLMPFWDFTTNIGLAHFVDSGLRYDGAPTETVYGLQHLEGRAVYGLANGVPVGPLVVTSGAVTLPFEAEKVTLGLGYESVIHLQKYNNGAADGTALGKTQRVHSVTAILWQSFGGEIGVSSEQAGAFVFDNVPYEGAFDTFEDVSLYTGVVGPLHVEPGYDREGALALRRPASSPLPFNVVAVMPQLHTQDA